jgi:periplasmic protein TonB
MPLARLHSIAVSLVLHAGLLGLAARGSSQPLPRASVAPRAALETIAIEAADALGRHEAASALPPSEPMAARPPVPSEALAASSVPRAPEPRVRPPRAAKPVPPREMAPLPVPASAPAAAPAAPVPPASGDPVQPPSTVREGGSEAAGIDAAPRASGPVSSGSAGSTRPNGNEGAGGATGSAGTAGARAQVLARYVERVRARVEQHREYPYLARRANLEGTICLRISIGASGGVLGVTPTCGTSHEPLLTAALKSVSSAAPFPPLPAALGGRLTLDVPVVFQLDSL